MEQLDTKVNVIVDVADCLWAIAFIVMLIAT